MPRPKDEKAFREWLNSQPFHKSWNRHLDDIARVTTHGMKGDDDLNLMWAGEDLWEKYCAGEQGVTGARQWPRP